MSDWVCTSCGYVGTPGTVTKGSAVLEVFLWLCFLVPGIIYTVWRLMSRQDGCPRCGQATLVPVYSPLGQKFVRGNNPEQVAAIVSSARRKARAQGIGKALGRAVCRLIQD